MTCTSNRHTLLKLAVSNRVHKHSFGWQWTGRYEEFTDLVRQLGYTITAHGWVRDGPAVIAFTYLGEWYVTIV